MPAKPPSGSLSLLPFCSRCRELEAELEELRAREAPRAAGARKEGASFLDWQNREFGRKFTLSQPLIRQVKALLAAGYEQRHMRLVALYLKSKWEHDERMADFLVPSTMLAMAKFQERLDMANEWWGEGE